MVYVYSVAKSLIFDPNCILHNNVFGTISTAVQKLGGKFMLY